jgi:hypothetical protein
MNFATKRKTRNRSYLLRVFVAERKIVFTITVNNCCEFDVIWTSLYDRRRDAFDFSDRVLRSRFDKERSRMNLLLYENRNVRFEKNFARIVRSNVDSRAYYKFVDVVKTICEEFLQWFVASIAKHVECVCREDLVEFAFELRVVFIEYDFVEYEKIINNFRLFVNVHQWYRNADNSLIANKSNYDMSFELRLKENQQTRMNAN